MPLANQGVNFPVTQAFALLHQLWTLFNTDPLGVTTGQIAFGTNRDGNDEIYVMNGDGTGLINLTNNPASDNAPVWSPDGTQLVFESNRDGNLELYVMNANGSGQTNLTNNPTEDLQPAWSHDGKQIAFSSDRNGNHEIYVMNADGSHITRLTDSPAFDEEVGYMAFARHNLVITVSSFLQTTQRERACG